MADKREKKNDLWSGVDDCYAVDGGFPAGIVETDVTVVDVVDEPAGVIEVPAHLYL